jgi:thioredoxin-related protein
MAALVIIEAVVIVMLVILVAGLLKSHAEILRRLDSLGAAEDRADAAQPRRAVTTGIERAPSDHISGVAPDGSTVNVSLSPGTGETLLAFLSTGCASCRVFWQELGDEPELPTPTTRPIVVTKGPASESPAKVVELAGPQTRVVMSDDIWDHFKVPVTPYFMLLDQGGHVVGEGSATNLERLRDLFRRSAADATPVRMSTRGREKFTDDRLSESGVAPGDTSLYENPTSQ